MNKQKDFKFSITKAVENEETNAKEFIAYASTDALDRHDEKVSKEALSKEAATKKSVPMFYGHMGNWNSEDVLGKFEFLEMEDNKLKVKGIFLEDDPTSERIYKLVKMGAIAHLSVGFIPKKWDKDENGNLVFTEIEIIETSIAPVPANPEAEIIEVKKLESKEKEMEDNTEILEAISKLQDTANEILSKIDKANGEETPEETKAAAAEIIKGLRGE